jgi:hypothetical protein
MKSHIFLQFFSPVTLAPLALNWALSAPVSAAGIPVVDAVHIASNRIAHAVDYVQQVVHEVNQQTQILKQVEEITQLHEQIDQLYAQIEQMDSYLDRFGDPKAIANLAGLDKLLGELQRKTEGLDIDERLGEIDGEGIFGFSGDGVFKPVGESFTIGDQEFERNAEAYKPEDATRETIEQYRAKKKEVIERRDALKTEVAAATTQLKAAATDSEVKKLTGVLLGLQTELQALDEEVDIAAADAVVRDMENANQRRAKAKAALEENARRFAEGNRKDAATYKIDDSAYGW